VATVSPDNVNTTTGVSSQETEMLDTSLVEPTTSTVTSSPSAPKLMTTTLVTTTPAKIPTEISAAVAIHFTYEATCGFGVRNPYIAA